MARLLEGLPRELRISSRCSRSRRSSSSRSPALPSLGSHRTRRRRRRLAGTVTIADSSASPSTAPSASAVFPTWFTPSQRRSRDPARRQPVDPVPSCPASRSPSRRAGSTTADSAVFYACSRIRPPTKPSTASEGLANNIFLGIVDTPTRHLRRVGESRAPRRPRSSTPLVANEALATSEPVDVTIGGLTGKQIDTHLDPDWTGSCPRTGRPADEGPQGLRGRIIFLDIPDGGSPDRRRLGRTRPISRPSSPRRCRSSRASSSTSTP